MDALAVANIIPSTNASSAAAGLGLDASEGSSAEMGAEGAFGELLGKQIALLDTKLEALITNDAPLAAEFPVQVIDPSLIIQQITENKELDDSADDKDLSALGDASASLLSTDLLTAPAIAPIGNLSPSAVVTGAPVGKDLPLTVAAPIKFIASDRLETINAQATTQATTQAELSDEFGAALAARLGAEKFQASVDATQGQSPVQTQSISAQAQTANAAPVSTGIPQQVGTPHWDTGLGDKVVWMLGTQTKMAELHLNPPNLGPLEVRISMSDGQANLSFMTQHNAVGEAIESAKSRLREMMGESGVNMGSVSVNVGSFAQQQQQQQAQQQNPSQTPDGNTATDITWLPEGEGSEVVTTTVQPLRDRGLVDLFA